MITPFDEVPLHAPAADPVHEALLLACARLRLLGDREEILARAAITNPADQSQVRAVKHGHMAITFRLAAAEVETLARVHELENKG